MQISDLDSLATQAQPNFITDQGSADRRRWLRDQFALPPAKRERAMPKRHPPFTYIPPTDIAPIACEHCGGKARLIRRSPLAADLKGEMRTFRCKGCDKQTKIIVQD